MAKTVLVWGLTIPTVGLMLLAALANLAGIEQAMQVWGRDQPGLRVFMGICEAVGSVALLVPRLAFWGAALLGLVLLVAAYFYVSHGIGIGVLMVLLLFVVVIGALRFRQALFLDESKSGPEA